VSTLRFLTDPDLAPAYWPGIVAAFAVGIVCAVLSPLVVLKRLSFVGQGISHAAFGGVGIARLLLVLGVAPAILASSSGQFLIVLAFCLVAAALIWAMIRRGGSQGDTAIGIVLVGSMTLGAILLQVSLVLARQAAARGRPTHASGAVQWESILFGSIIAVDWPASLVAWGVAVGILVALWSVRRPLLFWAFDEAAAPAFGVPGHRMGLLLVFLLALAIVTAMKLVGVVLATALLVLPGAAALLLADRLHRVIGLSLCLCLAGVCGGLALSFEVLDGYAIPPGAGIVAVLVLFYGAAKLAGRARVSGVSGAGPS
jgi:zinc transport system permease protein